MIKNERSTKNVTFSIYIYIYIYILKKIASKFCLIFNIIIYINEQDFKWSTWHHLHRRSIWKGYIVQKTSVDIYVRVSLVWQWSIRGRVNQDTICQQNMIGLSLNNFVINLSWGYPYLPKCYLVRVTFRQTGWCCYCACHLTVDWTLHSYGDQQEAKQLSGSDYKPW